MLKLWAMILKPVFAHFTMKKGILPFLQEFPKTEETEETTCVCYRYSQGLKPLPVPVPAGTLTRTCPGCTRASTSRTSSGPGRARGRRMASRRSRRRRAGQGVEAGVVWTVVMIGDYGW